MNKLEDYIKVFPNMIDSTVCQDTINDVIKRPLKKAIFKDYKENSISKPGEEERYEFHPTESEQLITTPPLMKIIWDSVHNYYSYYNLPHWKEWNGYTTPKIHIYKPSSIMSRHVDHITGVFDGNRKGIPTLSIVGLLNDDFTGGEFIMFDDLEIKLKKGDVLVFPSIFLYPHEVKPIKTGTRYSMVSWVW